MKKILWNFRKLRAVTLALLILTGATALRPALYGESNPGSTLVNIDNFSFGSGTLTVPAGTTVTWINRDDVPHTVVSTDKVFASSVLDTGDKFSYTFTKPGTYSYYCSVHPKMTAKVVVR
ncbi:MAG TPA: cupredoxin family copper-binding protein [Terriglobia bacterium]|nr:cupredoxin family copper-binding protein [Terriglobia bacterium]